MDEVTKQKLLEELRKEYRVDLKPLKEVQFSVADILDKYIEDICNKLSVPLIWNITESIGTAIRKVLCVHYGVRTLKEVPVEKRQQFREDTEKFIQEFILKEPK